METDLQVLPFDDEEPVEESVPVPSSDNRAADICVLDVSAFIWWIYHAEKRRPTVGVTKRVLEQVDRFRNYASKFIVAIDSPTSFRKQIDPTYKAQRTKLQPTGTSEITQATRAVRAKYPNAIAEGFEADDIIASVCQAAVDAGQTVVIVAQDKDLFQLIALPGVSMFNFRIGRIIREEDVIKKFGVPPSQVSDFLAMVGDVADNIKGIRNVGPKKAARVLASAHSEGITVQEAILRDLGVQALLQFSDARKLTNLVTNIKVEVANAD